MRRRGYHQRQHKRTSPKGQEFEAGRKLPYDAWVKRNRDNLMELWYLFREETGSHMSFPSFTKGTYNDPVKFKKCGYEICGMSMAEYYAKGKSKKEINERIASGGEVWVTKYEMFHIDTVPIKQVPKGTVIRVFEKYVGGQPYAKAYGTWDGVKVK